MAIKVDPNLNVIKEIQEVGGDTLKKCYQCATCATVCPLSSDEAPFPRKQMILAQWGFKDKLLNDPAVWLCHQCGDCSKYCPRGANPGDVMAALRLLVIKEAVPFKFLHTFYNRPLGLIVLPLIALFFIFLGMIATFQGMPNLFDANSFPYGGPHYDIWIFHLPARVLMIDVVFLPLAAFVVIILFSAINRMWNAYVETYKIPQAYRYGMWTILKTYFIPAISEILSHSRFVKCNANNWRANPHKFLLYSFIILALTTAIVFVMADILGFHTPWNPLTHPVKWLGNIGGILLLYGIIDIMVGRSQAEAEKSLRTSYPDSFLIYLILFLGLTGFGIEIIRSIPGLKNITSLVYLAHLVIVFMLFLGVVYSKFAHLAFRTTAVVFDLYFKDVVQKMSK
ncbi:quinone-interacting membrane-bound oxidoreductase complex subunit QmoC [Thermodesulfobacterium hydrogeniphilum]|uniref:quinone-interacting membrane-bound oxidoreductase complex subunit QmoC n=1 Tax=Thermodesulfobacterium hydrogeniphilum TaxID=161156 RepID=UPI000ABEB4AC|nr:quinone-interacting membrane-bound oxidoreductase complex subunit QmoC [Thermodesulfobacterium hydrogeniphilum]